MIWCASVVEAWFILLLTERGSTAGPLCGPGYYRDESAREQFATVEGPNIRMRRKAGNVVVE